MLNIEVPKEIEQENKIIAGLNLRQLVTVIVCGLICLLIFYLFGGNPDLFMIPCMCMGVVLAFVGWYKKGGLTIEKIIFKKMQIILYRNDRRPYKTKNRYITMYNDEYVRMRNIDMQDKKLAKQIKKEEKKKRRAKKKKTRNCRAVT